MIVTDIRDQINSAKITVGRKVQAHQLLEEFTKKKVLSLEEIKERNLVTALCWMQFQELCVINHIHEVNGSPPKIYYSLTSRELNGKTKND